MSLDVLTAIWRDPPCKGGDLLCLLAIADNADENGYAWPSISTIARKAAMGERGAQKCIRKLADSGLIDIRSGGGRNKTNAYQITTNGVGKPKSHINPEQNTPPPGSPFTSVNPEQNDTNPEPAFAKPRTPVHPNSHEPSIEPPLTPIVPSPTFEDFYAVCPRKVAPARAEAAWRKAIKKADPSEIVEAMRVYAKSREGEDQQFTKHPATWLNGGCWKDEPPPDRSRAKVDDFHDQFSKALGGSLDGLPRTNEADRKRIE